MFRRIPCYREKCSLVTEKQQQGNAFVYTIAETREKQLLARCSNYFYLYIYILFIFCTRSERCVHTLCDSGTVFTIVLLFWAIPLRSRVALPLLSYYNSVLQYLLLPRFCVDITILCLVVSLLIRKCCNSVFYSHLVTTVLFCSNDVLYVLLQSYCNYISFSSFLLFNCTYLTELVEFFQSQNNIFFSQQININQCRRISTSWSHDRCLVGNPK